MAEIDGAAPRQQVSLRQRFLSPHTAISFVALLGLIGLLAWRFDIAWSDTWATVRSLDPWWYGLAVAIHYLTFIFRGARWRQLLINAARTDVSPPPAPSVLYAGRVILMSWFANAVTWFRMGDAYRAYVYAEDTKTSFFRSAGTVLADRLVDLAIVATLMTIGITVLLVGGQVRPPPLLILVALGLLAIILAGLAGMAFARRWIAPRLPEKVRDVYTRFHDGTTGSLGAKLHLVFGFGMLGWLCEMGRLFFVLQALGAPVALGLVLFVPMANGLLSAVPLTPGGLGVVETGVSGLLRLELTVEVALAAALVDRTISYLSIILTGGIAFAVRQMGIAKRSAAGVA